MVVNTSAGAFVQFAERDKNHHFDPMASFAPTQREMHASR
jgi:hypothetical protein